MKSHPVTALHIWMTETGRTSQGLSKEINGMLSDGYKSNGRQVARWRKGGAIPRGRMIRAIETLSEGKVDANSFVVAQEAAARMASA